MPGTLVELRDEIRVKRDELHTIFLEAGGAEMDLDRVVTIGGDAETKQAEIRRRQVELSDLENREAKLANAEFIFKENERKRELIEEVQRPTIHPTGGDGGVRQLGVLSGMDYLGGAKSLRDVLAGSKDYRAFREGRAAQFAVEIPQPLVKTLVTLTNIYPQAFREPTVPMALEERTVADMMAQRQTSVGVVEYFEETTVTNAAATVAEGNTKPESALGWTLRNETVRKVATVIPVTNEVASDYDGLMEEISSRIVYMVRRVEEAQILNGNGVGTNLLGILNRSGIQTQAATAPGLDAVFQAIQKVRGSAGTGFAEPDGVVINPANWTTMKLSSNVNKDYYWGRPSDEGPERLWGLPVRQTTAMPAGTALVGAFRTWAAIYRREGITVRTSNEHSTFFVDNKIMLLGESRLALAVLRPSAFATVTGLT